MNSQQALEPLAREIARKHQLPEDLVCAIIEQESAWNPGASRHEPAFQTRYGPTYRKMFPYCRYLNDPGFYSSWGLMQVMAAVAWECDFHRDEPSMLCTPEIGIEAGCRLLVQKLVRQGWKDLDNPPSEDTIRRGLLSWNGGGRPAYVDEVLARVPKYSISEVINGL